MDAVKCPACGFETPEEQGHCDFCKEPFRKKPVPAPRPKPQPKVVVPPEVYAKLAEARGAAARGPAPAAGIPAEFAHLDPGERIVPPSHLIRTVAWGFLGFIVLAGAAALFWAVGRTATMKRPPRGRPAQAAQPAPAPAPADPEAPHGWPADN